ncbi:unnamed protein product [Rhizoctonia solani]|uniref:AIG1-type G domain-containing protein n=1 Tax=Rhizoctonia solani TaxID=456999 RepID=A0A8H2WZ94_9AGAM|nr:unnamed protein product [Rhizoctonia solani]
MTQVTPNAEHIGHGSLPIDPGMERESVKPPEKKSRLHYPRKKNVITILLIGETGSGKTSFMSLLLNLLQGNGPFELKEKHFIDAQSGLDRSQSQTTEARIYSFTTSDGVKVEILDTPGLADTRGIDEDKKHKERIFRAIQDLITVIDGVMIVANGRVERLTTATDYTLNILATFFPRSIIDNIGIIFTNIGTGGAGFNFQIQSLPHELQKVHHWCLDNPLSLYKNYSDQKASGNLSETKEARQKRNLEDNYDDAIESLDGWLKWLDERRAIPTTAIIELYRKSSHIESRLFATVTSIASLSKLESQLQATSLALHSAGREQNILESVQQKLTPQVWALEETTDHNTICTVPGCHSNCHTNCSLELGSAANIGGSCKAFKTLGIPNKWLPFWSDAEVKCGEAKCSHQAQAHRYYQQIHKKKDSEVYKRIVQDLKRTMKNNMRLHRVKTRIEKEVEGIKQEIEDSKSEIPRLIAELNGLSLSPNYAGYIWSALDVLKMRKEQLLSRHDPGNELEVINEGIKAFEAQLNLLRENEAGRVVETYAKDAET